MSFSIPPQNQLEINEAVVHLGEQLEKVPESFFYNLSAEQFDLCQRVQKYVQPVVARRAEFDAGDDLESVHIYKDIAEKELIKDFQARGVKSDDVSKMHEIADAASNFVAPTGWFAKLNGVAHSAGSSKTLHQRFDKEFHTALEEFKSLTEILRSKTTVHQEHGTPTAGGTLLTLLPQEIIQLILSMTDLDTVVAFTGVQKNIDKLNGTDATLRSLYEDPTWKILANQVGVEKLSPQIINNLRSTILNVYRRPIAAVVNSYTANPEYAQDPRFEAVFGRQRFLTEVAREKLTADNLQLLLEWKRTQDALSIWSRLERATGIRITNIDLSIFSYHSVLGLNDQSEVWREMALMRTALKGMGPWLEKNKAAISAIKDLNLSNIRLDALPEFMKEMRALQTLDLRGNHLTTLPEWFTNLTSLRQLTTDVSFPQLPEAMSNVRHTRF